MGVWIRGRWTSLDCGSGRERQFRLGSADAAAISLPAVEASPLAGAVPIIVFPCRYCRRGAVAVANHESRSSPPSTPGGHVMPKRALVRFTSLGWVLDLAHEGVSLVRKQLDGSHRAAYVGCAVRCRMSVSGDWL